jgi:hypothetical protein
MVASSFDLSIREPARWEENMCEGVLVVRSQYDVFRMLF